MIRAGSDVEPAWEYAQAGARVANPRVIVEGFVDFDYEITQLTVRGAAGTEFCAPIGHRQEHGDYVEPWQPHPMSNAAAAAGRDVAERITSALGGRGIFGVELFVRGDEVLFSEVELHARAVLGLPVDVSLREPGASAVIYGGVEAKAPVFDGVDEALAVPGADVRLFGKPVSNPRRRMGVATATADDVDGARERATRASALVRPSEG